MRVVVLGGLGFIGKHFLRTCEGKDVVNIDAITYAADKNAIPLAEFIHADICDLKSLPEHDVVVNFVAESHVDRSISDAKPFIRTNILGVQNLLNLRPKRLVHISTDEVYGQIIGKPVTEDERLNPSNPYAATKAAGDHLILSNARCYGLDYNIIRPSNTYGYGQHPEKLIPRTIDLIHNCVAAEVHGDGSYVRMWAHVDDVVSAIWHVIYDGKSGEIYNISGQSRTVLNIVEMICRRIGGTYRFVDNRPAQDSRYAVSDHKLRKLGWESGPFRLDEVIDEYNESRALHRYG